MQGQAEVFGFGSSITGSGPVPSNSWRTVMPQQDTMQDTLKIFIKIDDMVQCE